MAEVSLSQPLPIEERIPASAQYEKLSAGSVIRGRRVVKYVPSTGTSVDSTGGSQIITFRMSDSGAYLDPLSCYLTFQASIPQGDVSGSTGGVFMEDTALSFFNRVRVEVNSVATDDVVNNDSLSHCLLYLMGDKNAYCQDMGLLAGSWKFNDMNYGVADQTTAVLGAVSAAVNAQYSSEGSQNAVQRRGQVLWRQLYNADGSATTNNTYRFQFAIPLSYFNIGLFKQLQLIPLRNLGVITINLFTNTASRALRCGVASDAALGNTRGLTTDTSTASVSFALRNLAIIGSVVDLSPDYLSIVDRVSSTGEQGLVLPFSSFTNVQSGYTAAATPTDKTITFSRASTALRNLYLVRQPSAWRETPAAFGITGFPWGTCTGFRVQINSLYIPEYGLAETPVEQYALSRQGAGMLGNQDSVGNIRAEGYVNEASADSDINGQHVLHTSFDRVTSEYLALDGISTISSGGTISVYLRDAMSTDAGGVGNSVSVNGWLESTRFLTLRMNQVSVVG